MKEKKVWLLLVITLLTVILNTNIKIMQKC